MIPASIPSPPAEWASFSLGPVAIHAYALCILAGIVAALLLTAARFKRYGGNSDVVWDVAIWAVPFGLVGGRLYHVFSSPDAYFGPDGDLSRIPRIWEGGLGIWGAVALGAVGAWIGCRRAGVRLSAFADAAAPGVLLAQAIGRWGNWFNQELFGAPTDLPWGLEIDADNPNFPAGEAPGTLFHPTFLYESLWNLAGVALLLLLDRRFGLRGGRMFWLYAAYYTAGRVWIEALRIDDAEMITLFGVTQRLNVWTSVLVLVIALAIFIYLSVRQRGSGTPSIYLPGREPAAAEEREVGAEEDKEQASEARNGSDTDVHTSDDSAGDRPDRGNLPEIKDASGTPASAEPATEEPRESDSRK
ncbi:prolipoprotein diacylglyceryl transferase [Arthrobacter sp. JZ12]|uniref:prolipoprotein diacylglyceryl transferase n=1 Tax=Arthrobacter sp. JZ12 TaxID=2654190 RepID=UPI002B474A74|nr:prolipoprotein diacylglyceryl transferase [Arthrobacter sp. JZ12]WRH24869.1 prolipoprotein diacylglyceryl transferase [Arthrobacter sp. JZ12]